MLQVLEGLEAYGSYTAWALRHRQHPLVRRFSWDLGDPEPRLRLVVLRALLLAGRALWRPERLEAEESGEALSKALGRLGLEARSHELQDAFQSCTVKQLREKRLTKEAAERRFKGLCKACKVACSFSVGLFAVHLKAVSILFHPFQIQMYRYIFDVMILYN